MKRETLHILTISNLHLPRKSEMRSIKKKKKRHHNTTGLSERVKSIFIRNEIQNTMMQQDEGQQVNKSPTVPYPHPNPRKSPI